MGMANGFGARAEPGISGAEMGPAAIDMFYVDWIFRTLLSP